MCVGGGGAGRGFDKFLPVIKVFTEGRTDLPQEAIGPKGANRFSRGTGGLCQIF